MVRSDPRPTVSIVDAERDAFTRSHRTPLRSEPRREEVRIVEYTPFPRVAPDQAPRIGFTRDLSESGMCIGSDRPEPVGSLLRVVVRDADGQPGRPRVERVVWCQAASEGRHWLGLERVSSPAPS
jgi:hypothetical protein